MSAIDSERLSGALASARARAEAATTDRAAGVLTLVTVLEDALERGLFDFSANDIHIPTPHQRAHHNAPETSEEAADIPEFRIRKQHKRMLRAYATHADMGGLTNHEMADVLARFGWPLSQQSITPRNLEMRRGGPNQPPLVEDSGHRRLTPSNKSAVVWVLTAAGRSAAGAVTSEDVM